MKTNHFQLSFTAEFSVCERKQKLLETKSEEQREKVEGGAGKGESRASKNYNAELFESLSTRVCVINSHYLQNRHCKLVRLRNRRGLP